jgi:hypothetical protein
MKEDNINDFIASNLDYNEDLDPVLGSGEVATEDTDGGFVFNEDYNEKLKAYNAGVTTINPIYGMIKPRGYKCIVRVFVGTAEMEEGKITKVPMSRVSVPTNSGVGKIMEVASPYPFKTLGVVVSTGNYVTDLNPGDVVQLSHEAVRIGVIGQGDDMSLYLPYAYTHPNDEYYPEDPMDKGYGYLMIEASLIEAVIKEYVGQKES